MIMARADVDDSADLSLTGLILAAFAASPNGVVIRHPSGAIVAANDAVPLDAAVRELGHTFVATPTISASPPVWETPR